MYCARKVGHSPPSLISFWRPNLREQTTASSNTRNVREDGRRLGDRTIGLGHKRWGKTEGIDRVIGRSGLPTRFIANSLIGETTTIKRDVRSQCAWSRKIEQLYGTPLKRCYFGSVRPRVGPVNAITRLVAVANEPEGPRLLIRFAAVRP
jgi:hypothetical protein